MSSDNSTERRVNRVIAEHLARVDRGETVDREVFIAEHPEIAPELRSYFEACDLADRLAGPGRLAIGADRNETLAPARGSISRRETIDPGGAIDSLADTIDELPVIPHAIGRYRIIRPIGEGAMGSVYLAEDTQRQLQVALKIPKIERGRRDQLLERFFREARAAASLSHPNICPVYDVGEADGLHYIAMGFIDGRALTDFVSVDHPLPERQVAAVVQKIALALAAAHAKGIIHRDLKPSNILVNRQREPVVMDFGLARMMDDEGQTRITQSGILMGTPAYMSPEQVEAHIDQIGPATDIYSLGVILYELLTGQLLFQGSMAAVLGQIALKDPPKPSDRRRDVDRGLEAICLKMIAKRPAHRYVSMAAVATALDGYLARTAPTRPEVRRETETLAAFDERRAVRDARRERLEDYKRHALALADNYRFAPAARLLKRIERLEEPWAADYATWARGEHLRLKERTASLREELNAAYRLAMQLLGRHDYQQLIDVVEKVPAAIRGEKLGELLEQAIARRDEALRLRAVIREALARRRLRGLLPQVERLLELEPGNRKAHELRERLQRRQERFGRISLARPLGTSRLATWMQWTVILTAVVALTVTLGLMNLYLLAAQGSIRIVADDSQATYMIDGQPFEFAAIGAPLWLSIGPHELVVQRDGHTVHRQAFSVSVGRNSDLVVKITDPGPGPAPVPPPTGLAVLDQFTGTWTGEATLSNDDELRKLGSFRVAASGRWVLGHRFHLLEYQLDATSREYQPAGVMLATIDDASQEFRQWHVYNGGRAREMLSGTWHPAQRKISYVIEDGPYLNTYEHEFPEDGVYVWSNVTSRLNPKEPWISYTGWSHRTSRVAAAPTFQARSPELALVALRPLDRFVGAMRGMGSSPGGASGEIVSIGRWITRGQSVLLRFEIWAQAPARRRVREGLFVLGYQSGTLWSWQFSVSFDGSGAARHAEFVDGSGSWDSDSQEVVLTPGDPNAETGTTIKYKFLSEQEIELTTLDHEPNGIRRPELSAKLTRVGTAGPSERVPELDEISSLEEAPRAEENDARNKGTPQSEAAGVDAQTKPVPGPRNPFNVEGVPNPDDDEVKAFAAQANLSGAPSDANAAEWPFGNPFGGRRPSNVSSSARIWSDDELVGSPGSLEGNWASRSYLPPFEQSREVAIAKAEVKTVGDRVYIHVTAAHVEERGRLPNGGSYVRQGGHQFDYLIEARRDGPDRLIGRSLKLGTAGESTPWVGLIVGDDRIDGICGDARWDLRRRVQP